MDVVRAAVGGPGLRAEQLEGGVRALTEASAFEELSIESEEGVCARLKAPWKGTRGAWCDVDVSGPYALQTLLEIARSIARSEKISLLAVATVIENTYDPPFADIGYRAYEFTPTGSVTQTSSEHADRLRGSDGEREERLRELYEILVGDAPELGSERPLAWKRALRRRVRFADPRLRRLAMKVATARSVTFEPLVGERERVRIEDVDGARRIAIVSIDDARSLWVVFSTRAR